MECSRRSDGGGRDSAGLRVGTRVDCLRGWRGERLGPCYCRSRRGCGGGSRVYRNVVGLG